MKTFFINRLFLIQLTLSALSHSLNASEADFRNLFHLFNPVPQHFAQKRIHTIADRAHEKEAMIGNYEVAFMKELKLFLLEEIKTSFLHVALAQGNPIDDAYATKLADCFLKEKFEAPYQDCTGKELFEQNPMSLPEHCFTSCLREYLVPFLLKHQSIPTQTRGPLDIYGYFHMMLIGIDYTRKVLDVAENMITAAGVTRRF